MTALEALGTFVADGIRGRVPAATRDLVRLHVIDTVGAWVAGAHTAEGRALARLRGAGPELGTACALARLSELDNIHLASATTPGGIVIPAALVMAAGGGPDTDAVVEAIVAGTEAMVRLGAAIGGPAILYRGVWPTYFATPFAVAAVAARLYELDARQTAHALALALATAAAGVGRHGAVTTARWLAIAIAARNGRASAEAARAGFTSDLGLLDGGFLGGGYGITADVAAVTDGLGDRLALDATAFKPWCAARQTMAATQALRELMAAGLEPQSITSVMVAVPPPYLKMIDHGVTAGDRASHLTSVQHRLALAACDPDRLFDPGGGPARPAPEVQDFMGRIVVAADASLLAHYPDAWPARIAVRTPHGAAERTVIHLPGDPPLRFDAAAVGGKFARVTAHLPAAPTDLLDRARDAFAGRRWPADLVDAIMRAEPQTADI